MGQDKETRALASSGLDEAGRLGVASLSRWGKVRGKGVRRDLRFQAVQTDSARLKLTRAAQARS